MFKLTLELASEKQKDLRGLRALDRRRELGLSDASELIFLGTQRVTLQASEAWARSMPALFKDSKNVTLFINNRNLLRGAVVESGSDSREVFLNENAPIKLLWLVAESAYSELS